MIVNTPVDKRTVVDYDFTFMGGVVLQLTIDSAEGDTIEFLPNRIEVFIAPTTNIMDPTTKTQAESHTILLTHLFHYKKKEREITNLTPEEQFEWSKTIQAFSKAS